MDIVGVRNERCLKAYAKNGLIKRVYKRWVVYARAKKNETPDLIYKNIKLKRIFVGKMYQVRKMLWESKNGQKLLRGLDSDLKEKWLI